MSLISKGSAHLCTALLCFTYGSVGLEGHLSASPCLLMSREEASPFALQVLLAEAPVLGAKAQSGDGKKEESGHLGVRCRYFEVGGGEKGKQRGGGGGDERVIWDPRPCGHKRWAGLTFTQRHLFPQLCP